MIDRFGKCPNPECKEDWDAGEIITELRKLHVFTYLPDEQLVNMAHTQFGWSSLNHKHFSRVIAISHANAEGKYSQVDPDGPLEPDFYMCPNCRKVWDVNTGEQFASLNFAKAKKYGESNPELLNRTKEEATEGLHSSPARGEEF